MATVVNMAARKGTARYIFQLGKPGAFTAYKLQLGKALLLESAQLSGKAGPGERMHAG